MSDIKTGCPLLSLQNSYLFWHSSSERLWNTASNHEQQCPGVLFSISTESCGPLLAFLIFADGEWIIFVTIHLSKVAESWCNFQSPIPQSNIPLIYHKKLNHTAASYQTPSFKSVTHSAFLHFQKSQPVRIMSETCAEGIQITHLFYK